MKVFLCIALIFLVGSVRSIEESKKNFAKCLGKKEIISTIQAIKSLGLQNFLKAKLSLKGLMQTMKTAIECLGNVYNVETKSKSVHSVLQAIGMSSLYASNCEKDVGMVFLLLDNIVQQVQSEKKDWVGIVVESFMEYVVGQQTYGDCKDFYEYVRSLFQ